jgi:hypothetical protein
LWQEVETALRPTWRPFVLDTQETANKMSSSFKKLAVSHDADWHGRVGRGVDGNSARICDICRTALSEYDDGIWQHGTPQREEKK